MSDAAVISCIGCNRRFAWNQELAGKRVRCKCGEAITIPAGSTVPASVPRTPTKTTQPSAPSIQKTVAAPVVKKPVAKKAAPPKPVESDPDELDALYALAADSERAAANAPIEVVDFVPVPVPVAKTRKSVIPLAYQNGLSARQRQQAAQSAAALVDPRRDLYVPIALLAVGFLLYFFYFFVRFRLGSDAILLVAFGVTLLTAIKVVALVGFALVMAGPLGVGFGSLWTAVLKLAAMAVFVDGAVAWVDVAVAKMAGGFGSGGVMSWGIIGLPFAAGLYWTLLIYLFSMDSGDSWTVVICLSLFDRVVRFVLFMVLLGVILSWGGVAAPPGMTASPALPSASSVHTSELDTRVDEMKEQDGLVEAKKFITEGHQGVLLHSVTDWYSAGCKHVWFEMTGRDINRHRTEMALIVELPSNKAKRAKCYDVLKEYYNDVDIKPDPSDLKDTGENYLELFLR